MFEGMFDQHTYVLIEVGEVGEDGRHAEEMTQQALDEAAIPLSVIEGLLGGPVEMKPIHMPGAPGGDLTMEMYVAVDPVQVRNVTGSILAKAFGGGPVMGNVLVTGPSVDGVPQALQGFQSWALVNALHDHIASKGVPANRNYTNA